MSARTEQSVAVIGLGAMGLPMARTLLQAGFPVRGADINPASRAALADLGGVACVTPAEAVRGAISALIMVVNAAQVDDVLFGDHGAASSLAPGSVVILSVTMAPAEVQAVGQRLEAVGVLMLDMPVSGGVRGAESGRLVMLAAGPDAAYTAAQPVLTGLGGTVFRVGDRHGQGATVKLLNQLLCGVHLAATAEVMALAERAGVDCRIVHDVIRAASGMSRMFDDRAPQMWAADGPVKSAIDLFVKDLGLVGELGQAVRSPTYLASMAHELFAAAAAAGLGRANDSRIIEVYRGRSA
jgi:L-threonate 2-dehydrogenase